MPSPAVNLVADLRAAHGFVEKAANAEIGGYKTALAKAQQFKQEFDEHVRYLRENYLQQKQTAPLPVAPVSAELPTTPRPTGQWGRAA